MNVKIGSSPSHLMACSMLHDHPFTKLTASCMRASGVAGTGALSEALKHVNQYTCGRVSNRLMDDQMLKTR